MSGVGEAALLLGLITSCIAVIETSKKLLDAANDAHGLPKALRVVHAQLPLIHATLKEIETRAKKATENECPPPVKQAVECCKENAEELNKVLEKVIPDKTDPTWTKWYKHAKAVGKGDKVESLTQNILKQFQILQTYQIFANVVTNADLEAAISQLEHSEDEDGTYNSYGSGPINVAQAGSNQTNHNYSGNFHTTGTLNVGPGTK